MSTRSREAVESALSGWRRVGGIEDVFRDHQGVDLVVVQGLAQPGKEGCVLTLPQEVVERVTEVLVRGVKAVSYTHLTLPTNREV